ncbi:MAG: hypothetical protein L3K17_05420 [Thermoplasmata archaeon]|nr:hypothetical protein [Thermoplasmata archaeon]
MDLEGEIHRWHAGALIRVPSSVRRELVALERRNVPRAALARTLANRFSVVRNSGKGDAAIVRLARRLPAAVVTADRALRDRLAALGVTVLVPRDRARLVPFSRRAAAGARATVKTRPPLEGRRRAGRSIDA